MGVSTDAILCYGFMLTGGEGPELPDWLDEDECVLEMVASGEHVEIVQHCSGDYTMYILAAKESVTTANRGYPKKLGQMISVVQGRGGWEDRLREFCEEANIEYQEPQWLLCSWWC